MSGTVTAEDYAPLNTNFGVTTGMTYFEGDMDFSGTVTAEDYAPLNSNYNPDADPLSPAAVPEPGTIGLLGIAAAPLLARRRRRARG